MTMLGYDPRMEAFDKQVSTAPSPPKNLPAEINDNIFRAISVLDSCQAFLAEVFGLGILESEKAVEANQVRSEGDAIFTRLLTNSRSLAAMARSVSVAVNNAHSLTGNNE
jgi:hypothetical protein